MRRLLLGSLTAGLVLCAGACGDDTTEPAADPTTPSSSAAIVGQPDEVTSPADPTPTEAAVAPATGALISSDGVTVNAPADFRAKPVSSSTGGNVNGKDARYNIALDDRETTPLDASVDGLARLVRTASIIQPPLERQADTTVAGQPAYHLSGVDSTANIWADEYGFYAGGRFIKIIISTPLDMPQPERDAIAGPVLASVKLTG